jgi:hypothetical protein
MKNGGSSVAYPVELWREIELACVAGMSFVDAEKQFGVKSNTIRIRATRLNWPTPAAIARRAKQLTTRPSPSALDKVAESWTEKAELHRGAAFAKASKAIAASKIAPPRTWHDFDLADKAARRAAGLDNTEVVQQTLVNINEMAEGEVIEAEPASS